MKLRFDPNQDFQLQAIRSTVDVFEGQPLNQGDYEFSFEGMSNEDRIPYNYEISVKFKPLEMKLDVSKEMELNMQKQLREAVRKELEEERKKEQEKKKEPELLNEEEKKDGDN